MKLDEFVKTVVEDVCKGIDTASGWRPQTIEMNVCLTASGEVTEQQQLNAGRVTIIAGVPMRIDK